MHFKSGPNIVIRAIWFIFIGWWLTGIVSAIAWIAMVTIIGLPLGAWLLNRIPTVVSLRPRSQHIVATAVGGATFLSVHGRVQQPWYVRLLWFVFIGFWASAIWLVIAYLLVLASVITLGLTLIPALLMYNRVPFVATLYRY